MKLIKKLFEKIFFKKTETPFIDDIPDIDFCGNLKIKF